MLKKHLLTVSAILLAGALSLPQTAWATQVPDARNASVSQQNGKVTISVVDATGPVVGASVVVKGTNKGSVSDAKGEVALEGLKRGDVLQISFVGYVTQEIVYNGQSSLKVSLAEDSQSLDELVIVGYGTQKKESLTGALQTIDNKKLTDVTTPSVENMLSGKVSGVFVAPGSGQPGSQGAVMVRGKSTLSGTTAPLWVIDGVIVGTSTGLINPADIETMTILNDAASTAIYG